MIVIQRTWMLFVLALFLGSSLNNGASAQSVAGARAAYMEADFQSSVSQFERVLQKSTLSKREAVEAHRYLATLQSILGSTKSSSGHVRAALAIDSEVKAAPGSPESVIDAFALTREEFGRKEAKVVIDRDRDGDSILVTATLVPAPEALVDKIRLLCTQDGAQKGHVAPLPSVSLRVKAFNGEMVCEAKALTEKGAALFTQQDRFKISTRGRLPGLESLGSSGDRQVDSGTKRKKWPWIVGVVGAVVVGGTVAGIMLAKRGGGDNVELTGVTVTGWP